MACNANVVWAADKVVREAQALVDKGQPQAAYDLQKPMAEAHGDTEEAKGEFDKLKDMNLPSDVERTIDSYLSSIDQYHDRSRLRYRP